MGETRNYKNGQCTATTKKGEQCLSGAQKHTTLCGPHEQQANRLLELEHGENAATEVLVQEAEIANKEKKLQPTRIFVHGRKPHDKEFRWDFSYRVNQRAAIKARLEKAVEVFGDVIVVSTGVLGAAQDAASVAYKMGIPFELYLPCLDVDRVWDDNKKGIFRNMVQKASLTEFVNVGEYDGKQVYDDAVDAAIAVSDYGLFIYNGKPGYMASVAAKAKNEGLKYTSIDPSTF